MTTPDFALGKVESNSGTSATRPVIRFVLARSRITAMSNFAKCCWNGRFRSTVTNTSNSAAALLNSWPFDISHPTLIRNGANFKGADAGRPTENRHIRPEVLSTSIGYGKGGRALKKSDYLCPGHRGKPLKKFINRIASLKVFK